MKRIEVVETILNHAFRQLPCKQVGSAFAVANIALCKYWGKRDFIINLPINTSLSISLGDKGTNTQVSLLNTNFDRVRLNGNDISLDTPFAIRLVRFLDLFRPHPEVSFFVDTQTNLPVGAGLASSACGFAALVLALDQLFQWKLSKTELSILARLGSGSASRSLWPGFVKWNVGKSVDGMDSFAERLTYEWQDLCVGLLIVSKKHKKISSRKAMQRTIMTSNCYKKVWSTQVAVDLKNILHAIETMNFDLLGQTAESNALLMHASMLTAQPPIMYMESETIEMIQRVWFLREEGVSVYFTQDAGPNIKLLFLKADEFVIRKSFPEVEIIYPFK